MTGISATLTLILTLGGSLAPQAARAEWNPITFCPFESVADDFSGPIDNDDPVTWKNSWGITMTAEEGDLMLSDPLPLGDEFALGLNEVWKDGRRIIVADTSIQAVIRLGNASSFVGIYTRAQDSSGDGGSYVGNMFPDGEISVSSFGGVRHSVNTPLDPLNSEVTLQFDTIGNKITLTAWETRRPKNIYSTTWTDEESQRPLGFLGLGVGGGGADSVEGEVIVRSFKITRVQPFFLEDFEDGDAGDGNPVTWALTSVSAPGSTGRVVNESYYLTAGGDSSVYSTVWAGDYPSIGDVSVRAIVRGLSMSGTDGTIVVFARQQPLELGRESYWGAVTPLGLHTGMNTGPSTRSILGTRGDTSLNPFGKDTNVQLDVVGRRISFTVWPVGSRKPSSPQLSSTAPSALPSGRVGFSTNARQIKILSFDAIRIGNSLQPTLNWEQVDGNVLRFTIPEGYILQSSPTADSPQWSDVNGTGSIEVIASDPAKFFQLRTQ